MVNINGMNYYYDGTYYYQPVSRGYVVVEPPQQVVVQPVYVQTQQPIVVQQPVVVQAAPQEKTEEHRERHEGNK